MVVIRVLLNIKPEANTDFVNHMQQEMVEVKQKFAGCKRFALYDDVSKEDAFLIYEEWQSKANFEAYKNSDYFKHNGEKLFAMMAEKPDSAYFSAEVLP